MSPLHGPARRGGSSQEGNPDPRCVPVTVSRATTRSSSASRSSSVHWGCSRASGRVAGRPAVRRTSGSGPVWGSRRPELRQDVLAGGPKLDTVVRHFVDVGCPWCRGNATRARPHSPLSEADLELVATFHATRNKRPDRRHRDRELPHAAVVEVRPALRPRVAGDGRPNEPWDRGPGRSRALLPTL
jgi:hypothetical protein